MKRRPSPALIVAILALVVATGGTAFAQGILIRNSNQLADAVVTAPKIADRAVNNRKLSNPVFTAAVDPDGTVSSGQSVNVNQALTHKVDQVGGGVIYEVGFNQDVSQCVFSATPGRTRRGGTLSPVFLNPQSKPSDPRVVTVFVRDKEGSFFTPIRPSFHLLVVC
jgi:hypothetical protein